MKLLYKAGDLIKIRDSDSKTVMIGIVLNIDWGWSDLFAPNNRNNLKIGLIKMLSKGKIRSATTMDIIEIVSKL
tara:strand:+ start:1256 stop:1477 length:222 start_codon:yes stop_codon:yes gene_type:complete